jgi:hypothetical protein
MLVCDKCGASINEGSMFCAQCGDPVTEEDKVKQVVTASNAVMAQISFGNSSSAGYAKAIGICEKLPSYEVIGEGRQIQHKVTLPLTEVELVSTIFDLVGSWKSSQMLINGQPATKKDLSYYGVGCYRSRQKSYKPEAFCFGERQYEANIWGCKKLGMPIYEWGGGWLDYGQFDSKGVWHFDKARIRHELEIALKENELCPVINRSQIFETLENLPEDVDPKVDKNWQYRTTYEEVKGSYKEVAVGIRPVIKKVNRYIVSGFKPEWEEEPQQSAQKVQIEVDAPQRSSYASRTVSRNAGKRYSWFWIVLVILFLIVIFK